MDELHQRSCTVADRDPPSQPSPDNLVEASKQATVEMSETDLSQVSGGDKTAPVKTKGTTQQDYYVVTLNSTLISST